MILPLRIYCFPATLTLLSRYVSYSLCLSSIALTISFDIGSQQTLCYATTLIDYKIRL